MSAFFLILFRKIRKKALIHYFILWAGAAKHFLHDPCVYPFMD